MSDEAKKNAAVRYAVVPVAGSDLLTMTVDGEVYVAMRPCVEALGLDWSNEYRRITKDPILSSSVVNLTTEPPHRREVLCLPLRMWHGWLFKLNLNTINERARPIVEGMQVEGYQVLHDYWTKGYATNPSFARLGLSERSEAKRGVERYARLLIRESHPAYRRLIHQLLEQDCATLGIDTPALDQLGHDAPTQPDIVRTFWNGIEILKAKGIAINHSRRGDLLALSMKEVEAHFKSEGIAVAIDRLMKDALKLNEQPRFVKQQPVNSGLLDKTVNCWIFHIAEAVPLLSA